MIVWHAIMEKGRKLDYRNWKQSSDFLQRDRTQAGSRGMAKEGTWGDHSIPSAPRGS